MWGINEFIHVKQAHSWLVVVHTPSITHYITGLLSILIINNEDPEGKLVAQRHSASWWWRHSTKNSIFTFQSILAFFSNHLICFFQAKSPFSQRKVLDAHQIHVFSLYI